GLFIHPNEDLPKILMDNYWQPFRLACSVSMPVQVRVVALDSLQKLIAHGLLEGSNPIAPPKNAQIKKDRRSGENTDNKQSRFSETNDLNSLDITSFENEAPAVEGIPNSTPSNFPNPARLIDDVVHTICVGFVGPHLDQTVQLQILKVLLTVVTSETCQVHGISLLKVIQTTCNIYCFSKNPIHQATAKGELTQMANLIVSRCEDYAVDMTNYENHKKEEINQSIENSKVETKQLNGFKNVKDNDGIQAENSLNPNIGNGITEWEGTIGSPSTTSEESQELYVHEPSGIMDSNSDSGHGPNIITKTNESHIVTPTDDKFDEKNIQNNQSEKLTISSDKKIKLLTLSQDIEQVQNSKISSDSKDSNAEKPDNLTRKESIQKSLLTLKTDLSIKIPPVSSESKKNIKTPNPAIPTRSHFNVLRKDLYLTFRLFCRLSMRIETNSYNEEISIRGRSLVLELILSMLDNSGPVFRGEQVYIDLIRQSLCVSLSQNGVSSNEQLFELSLSIFLLLLRYYAAPLKAELEVLFSEIYLRFLDMSNASYKQKQMVLQGLMKLCANPQTLVDLYLNYDCDISMASLFERIVHALSRVAQGRSKNASGSAMGSLIGAHASGLLLENRADLAALHEKKLKVRGLKCLVTIIKSLVEWCKDLDGNNSSGDQEPQVQQNREKLPEIIEDKTPVIFSKHPLLNVSMKSFTLLHANTSNVSVGTNDSDDHPAQYQEIMTRKQTLQAGIRLFNTKPQKGLQFLIENNFCKKDTDDVVSFLMTTPGLNKAAIGEYLGESDAEAIKVMHTFVDRMDFTGLGFVDALRSFLQTFRLPGESQKISRIMEKFADRYCETNPDIFANADTAYTLAYSVIMLNTDQHSAQVKRRMDKSEFIKNNRGINNNNDLPQEFLGAIFDNIAKNEIVLEDEQISEVAKTAINIANERERQELYDREISQMQKKSHALLSNRQTQKNTIWRSGSHFDHVKPMFAVACWPVMATLSLVFEESENLSNTSNKVNEFAQANSEAVEICLDGFMGAIRISSVFRMDVERDAFVSSLAKLTGLNHVDEMRSKNVAAIRTLLSAAHSYGEGLQKSWFIVLKTISTMERYQLIDSTTSSVSYYSDGHYNGLDYSTNRNNSTTSNGTSVDHNTPTTVSVPQLPRPSINTSRRGSLGGLMREFQSQSTIVAIDRIFANSVNLSSDAIVHFLNALCAVSLEEVDSSVTNPRMYSLQRIVEIAYYNMSRIRFEWTQIWKILQPHFNTVGCHPNQIVATFAIDSLRQLGMKFLERDELAHYNAQCEFIKPFEHIIKNTPSGGIHDLIISSLIQMISARANNIKSGWKSIFIVFGRAASDENPHLVDNAFNVIRLVYRQHMDLIGPAFGEYVNCLVEFAFNAQEESIINESIRMMQGCLKALVKDLEDPEKSEKDTNLPVVPLNKRKYQHIEEEQFFLKWFPVISGLSRLVIDYPSLATRNKALDTLFDILKSNGYLFETSYWNKILRNALLPIFEDLKETVPSQLQQTDVESKKRETTHEIWIQTTRLMAEIYARFQETFTFDTEYIVELLSLLIAMLKRKHEKLGQTAIRCFHNIIVRNGARFDAKHWEIITTTLEDIFKQTTPNEFFEVELINSIENNDRKNEGLIIKGAIGGGALVPSNTFGDVDKPKDLILSTSQQDKQSNLSKPPIPKVNDDVLYALNKCSAQLVLIQSVKELVLSHAATPWSNENVHFLTQMPAECRNRWLRCLYNSYKFAHDFNARHDLRHALWKSGYVEKMPNLAMQETLSLSVFLQILFDLYRTIGDDDPELLPPLVEKTLGVLEKFISIMTDPSVHNQPRELATWSPLVVTLFKELCVTSWDVSREDDIDSEGDVNEPKEEKKEDQSVIKTPRLLKLRKRIPDFYKLTIKMIGIDRVDVRVAMQEFLEKVGNEFLSDI
ncbi:9478_t:CDS:2, partial [Ambispora leptoticha]